MASFVKVAAGAAGLNPSDIMTGPISVAIIGTGVDLLWVPETNGRGKAGWQVRETYHVVDLASGAERSATDVVASYGAEEFFQAARQAALSVIQRRVEAALSQKV